MRRLYLIELFAGTHSVSKAVRRSTIGRDFDARVLSVDINSKFQPSVVADIVTWRYKGAIDVAASRQAIDRRIRPQGRLRFFGVY